MRRGRVARCHRRGARSKRTRDRHRLPRRATRAHPRAPSAACSRSPARSAYEEVVRAVHEHLPPAARAVLRPAAAAGRAADAAPLRVSQDRGRLQQPLQLLHHPAMRGRLASRRIDEVLREAERLVRAGVKELLVISQDTSAYGADLRYVPARAGAAAAYRRASSTWRARSGELARLGAAALRVSVSARRCGHRSSWPRDGVLPYLDMPFQHGSARRC